MIVIGGHPNGDSQSESSDCALYPGPGPAFFFNLNTCQVQETGWDPTVKTDYRVPDKVVEMIGGGYVAFILYHVASLMGHYQWYGNS